MHSPPFIMERPMDSPSTSRIKLKDHLSSTHSSPVTSAKHPKPLPNTNTKPAPIPSSNSPTCDLSESFKKHITRNRGMLNRSKTETDFQLASSEQTTPIANEETESSSSNPTSSYSKIRLDNLSDLISFSINKKAPVYGSITVRDKNFISKIQSKIKSGSSVSLEPLTAQNSTDYLTDSLRRLNAQGSGHEPCVENKANSTSASLNKTNRLSRSKKKVSTRLSIMDYSNIMNLNTSHQLLADYLETTATDKDSPLSKKMSTTRFKSNPTHYPSTSSTDPVQPGSDPNSKQDNPQLQFQLNNYIQKQATLSEQMASLFGSSMCTCNLCRMKTVDSKRILQHNYEIKPSPASTGLDYTLCKYTYSNPFSELSTLKLFNLMNTDCSIFFNTPSEHDESFYRSRLVSNNNTVLLPFGSTDELPVNNSIKVNNNTPPLYDSRYLYLIDCRALKSDFHKHRIQTAIHYSDLMDDSVYLSPPFENYTVIVLYDEDGSFLSSSFEKIKQSTKSTAPAAPTAPHLFPYKLEKEVVETREIESDFLIESVRAKINCSQSKTIYVLSGGYKEFYAQFPFMCSHLNVRSTVDRNKYLTIYPNCVIENQFYIGSGIQAKNWKIVRNLRVTHIINATYEHECVFKNEITYLHVEVDDSHEEKIHKTFKSALEFIKNAFEEYQQKLAIQLEQRNKSLSSEDDLSSNASSNNNNDTSINLEDTRASGNGNAKSSSRNSSNNDEIEEAQELRPPVFLIHCNLGISRSSSILIAYLICKYRLCLYAAFKYVKDKRLQIAPNYSFLRQLKQFEENLT